MKTGKSNNSHNFLSPYFSSSLCPPVSYTSFVYGKVTACEAAVGPIKDHTRLELPHPTVQGLHPPSAGTGSALSSSTQRAQVQRQAVVAARFSLDSNHQVRAQWSVRSARQSILVAWFGSGLISGAAHSSASGGWSGHSEAVGGYSAPIEIYFCHNACEKADNDFSLPRWT